MQRELLTLGDYVGVLRRRKWWVLVLLVTGIAAAYAYASHQERLYAATAQVTVANVAPPTGLGGAGAAGQQSASSAERYISDQATLAHSPVVASLALKTAKVPGVTASSLLAATTTTPNSSADVFSITVKAASPRDAATLAAAYGKAFVQYRQALNSSTFAPLVTSLTTQITKSAAALKVAPKGEHDVVLKQLQGLQKQFANLQAYVALQDRGTSVVGSPTTANAVLAQPKTPIDLALGAGGGLLLGIMLAFVLDALDVRTRSTKQISDALRLPIVGRIPTPLLRLRRSRRLVMMESNAPHADAFRKLAARLAMSDPSVESSRTIMVTSAIAQEGKTTTACNLAIALAEIQARVVLVDLDLVRPTVATFLDVAATRGITDVLEGAATLDDARTRVDLRQASDVQPIDSQGWLDVVAAGSQRIDPTTAVASPKLAEILSDLANSADFVIIDTPPALAMSHAMLVSRCADAILAIARVDALTVDVAQEFEEALAAMAPMKMGFVLTGAEKESRRYGGGYGYGYGYPRHDYPPSLGQPPRPAPSPTEKTDIRARISSAPSDSR